MSGRLIRLNDGEDESMFDNWLPRECWIPLDEIADLTWAGGLADLLPIVNTLVKEIRELKERVTRLEDRIEYD